MNSTGREAGDDARDGDAARLVALGHTSDGGHQRRVDGGRRSVEGEPHVQLDAGAEHLAGAGGEVRAGIAGQEARVDGRSGLRWHHVHDLARLEGRDHGGVSHQRRAARIGQEALAEIGPDDERAAELEIVVAVRQRSQWSERPEHARHVDILNQVSSVHEALRGVGRLMMKNYLERCASKAIRSGGKRADEVRGEILDLMYKYAK